MTWTKLFTVKVVDMDQFLDKQLRCCNGCCKLEYSSFTTPYTKKRGVPRHCGSSAGVAVIRDGCVMLTQSYNNFWGIPKGKMEPQETLKQCALRELNEESGIALSEDIFNHDTKLHKYTPPYDHNLTIHIFIYETVDQFRLHDNLMDDSTGRGWIKLSCLRTMHHKKRIKLNKLTKYMLKRM